MRRHEFGTGLSEEWDGDIIVHLDNDRDLKVFLMLDAQGQKVEHPEDADFFLAGDEASGFVEIDLEDHSWTSFRYH